MERRTSLVARLVGGHPVVADWLLTGVVTLVALGQRFGMPERSAPVQSTALGVLFALAGSVPIAWRRRFPLQVLAITELVVLVELALGFDRVVEAGGVGPGVVVALYTVATSCPWPVSAWAAAVVVVLNTAVLLAWQLFAGGVQQDAFPALLLLGGSWLVGDNGVPGGPIPRSWRSGRRGWSVSGRSGRSGRWPRSGLASPGSCTTWSPTM
jgi:hypothetical protein